MDWQLFTTLTVIFVAVLYLGALYWRARQPKGGNCGGSCGCSKAQAPEPTNALGLERLGLRQRPPTDA